MHLTQRLKVILPPNGALTLLSITCSSPNVLGKRLLAYFPVLLFVIGGYFQIKNTGKFAKSGMSYIQIFDLGVGKYALY